MRALDRLDGLDRAVMGVNRWKRRLARPEEPAALLIWDQLAEEQRDAACDAAVWGQAVPEHPGVALVAADFQLQMISQLIRGIAWYWLGAAGLVVTLVATSILLSLSLGAMFVPAVAFLGPLIAWTVLLRKIDRARMDNMRIAHDAGLR